MNDHDFSSGEDTFTAEEQAAFDAYASGSEPAAREAPAPEAAPAAAPAAPGEAAVPGDVVDPEDENGSAEENRGKFVRHGAFHQERERRKALEKELAETREKYARGDERLRLLSEAMQRPAAPAAAEAPAEPPKPIDPAEDIFGAYAQLQKELADLRSGQTQQTEAMKRQEEARQAEAAREGVLQTYRTDIQSAAQADASFVPAYRHLIDGRVAEMKLLGLSDADAIKAVNEEEFTLVQAALQRGQSPAAVILQLAKGRGFVAKAPEAAPAAEEQKPQETAAEKAARVAAGQAGPGRSLSAAGGAPAGEITLEMLTNMPEAEFEKLLASNPARVRALMGG